MLYSNILDVFLPKLYMLNCTVQLNMFSLNNGKLAMVSTEEFTWINTLQKVTVIMCTKKHFDYNSGRVKTLQLYFWESVRTLQRVFQG